MNIQKIEIKNLFGELHHLLEFKATDKITYLIGRNGSGKTTLLKSIDAIANSNWNYLKRIEFDEMILNFFDDGELKISKTEADEYGNRNMFVELTADDILFEKEISIVNYTEETVDELIKELIDQKELRVLGCGHWASDLESHLRENEILERYGSSILNLPDEVSEFLKKIDVRFLSSERLISDEALKDKKHGNKRCYKVEHIAEDLKNKLSVAQRQVFKNLENVGDELEQDLLNNGFGFFDDITKDDFEDLYKKYLDERIRLESVNLSTESKVVEITGRDIQPDERKLIAHIIKQRMGAYEPYSELLFNIEIFHDIVNSALTKKEVNIDIYMGLDASSTRGHFPVNHLSSGEQQVIILAHTLLFSMNQNSTALIDEPELSMDVEWQSKLSQWLDKIGEKRNLKFIMATHSPLLLMGREDSIKTLNA